MPITDTSELNDVAAAREVAESALADAKAAADQLRVHHTRVALRAAFPEQSLAIFARYPNEYEGAHLIQLLSENTVIDLQGGREELTREQHRAIDLANIAIASVGDDDELLKHLEASDEEHDDWYEFQLTLRPDTDTKD